MEEEQGAPGRPVGCQMRGCGRGRPESYPVRSLSARPQGRARERGPGVRPLSPGPVPLGPVLPKRPGEAEA